MAEVMKMYFRDQLMERRTRLENLKARIHEPSQLEHLLHEVDDALLQIEEGTFGLCEICHEAIEPERLVFNPLEHYCLDHLTPNQQHALENDLILASQIQHSMLPPTHIRIGPWEASTLYAGAGPVGGDYCDILTGNQDTVYFAIGDISGKGVAASLLMAHLQASFRSLVPMGLPLHNMVERISHLFCESTMAHYFATLVCGRAHNNGYMEICNAGHPSPLVVRDDGVERIEATGMPVGMFCSQSFSTQKIQLLPGETVFFYTDGVFEASDAEEHSYGLDRLQHLVASKIPESPEELITRCREDLEVFLTGAGQSDDITLMAIRLSDQ